MTLRQLYCAALKRQKNMPSAHEIISESPQLNMMVACQPVFARNREVAAFDLLLQPPAADADTDADMGEIQAAVPVVLENYARVFQHGKTLTVPTIFNLSQQMLLHDSVLELPRKELIIGLNADARVTAPTVDRLRQLARDGHRLALAGYQPGRADLLELLDIVHILRLDVADMDAEHLRVAAGDLRGRNIALLADGVASGELFSDCVDLGFTYFQGAFLSEVTPVAGKQISGNKLLLLQLLEKLDVPEITASSLEALAIRDANLTYRILRIVNSAALGTRREVDTISQAITLLGTEEIKRWVNLFLVEAEPGKPGELTRSMLVRARMCEILAELDNRPLPLNHFIVGLLSRLDAMMDISMDELVEQLPLGRESRLALLHREGSQGEILAEVERYEQGNFAQLGEVLEPVYYEAAYRHACAWARQVQSDFHA